MTRINYIIPIKHPSKIKDPDQFVRFLGRTLDSIARQYGEKRIFIAANPGTPLPTLPGDTTRVEVDLAPPDESGLKVRSDVYSMIRKDKGTRIAAALEQVGSPDDLVMIVDDDDVLHQRLGAHVNEHDTGDHCGFVISRGYMHRAVTDTLYAVGNFHKSCGTSLLIRRNRFLEPGMGGAYKKYIAEIGSHLLLPARLKRQGERLTPIPFRAAIYCTGGFNSSQRDVGAVVGEAATTDVGVARRGKLMTDKQKARLRRDFPFVEV